jgi:acetoin utilization deacetylase AcuC-like enzyme
VYHSARQVHDPKIHIVSGLLSPHPENGRRSTSIINSFKSNNQEKYIFQISEREATDLELKSVHTTELIHFISNAWNSLAKFNPNDNDSLEVVPEVIPPVWHGGLQKPNVLHLQAGVYCYDTATPIGKYTVKNARKSAAIAIDSAKKIIDGQNLVFAICRPPGHHATRDRYGGYCYFNNAALGADLLSKKGKVVVLDLDYHHGNGTQDIFYERYDVFYLSIHGSPDFEYPFFSGYAEECGKGSGFGYNLNFPLPAGTTFETYQHSFNDAIGSIKKFNPTYIVISLGLDAVDGDPLGQFLLKSSDYRIMSKTIKELNKPVLVVFEGGYSESSILVQCAEEFISGFNQ